MKKFVKTMAAVMAGVIMCVGFSACGSQDSGKSEERSTLRVEIFDRGNVPAGAGTITDNALTKWIQKEFGDPNNIDVEFVSVPRDQELQQLNVLMAAGEAPDVVFTYNYVTMYDYWQNGGLADLTEYVDKAENLKKLIGEDVLKYGEIEGKQILIPGRRVMTARTAQIIRQDWLDKLGLQAPTNKEELYQVLKAFKEKDPGQVGEKNISWAISTNTATYLDLIYSFAEKDAMTEAEAAVSPWPMKKGFKEGVRFMNKLYNEGLISPDFALDKDGNQMTVDFANGNAGFINDNFGAPFQSDSYYSTLKKNIPTATVAAVDAFTDKDGNHPKEIYTPVGLYIAVPKSSKNIENAIKYLDWMSQEDVLRTIQFGWEGETYTVDENGFPSSIESEEAQKKHWYHLGFDTGIVVNGMYLGDQEKSVEYNAVATGENKDIYMQSYEYSVRDGYAPVVLPPNDSLVKYEANISAKMSELLTKSIMASPADFDKVYDDLQKEFVEVGGKEVNEAALKQYDEIILKK